MLRARSDAIDLNEYTVTWLVRQRLREREADSLDPAGRLGGPDAEEIQLHHG